MSQNWAEGVRSFGNNPNTFVYPGPGGSAGGCCQTINTTVINNYTVALEQGAGPPTTAPPNPSVTAAYWDTMTGILYYWNTTTQAWT